jgi:GxGYxYP putative glycoside hydrolase C-terminal domain
VGWQIGANAIDFQPSILDYYYKHAKPTDCFMNALTGVGYIHEDCYGDNYPPAQREQIWKEYLAISAQYRGQIDASALTTFSEMEPERLARFAAIPGFDGVFANYGTTSITTLDNEVTLAGGKPVFRALSGKTTEFTFTALGRRDAEAAMIAEVQRFTPGTRPAFLHAFLANWLSHMEMVDNTRRPVPGVLFSAGETAGEAVVVRSTATRVTR